MNQTQYATETYTDTHLANELADILRHRVRFAMAGIIVPLNEVHFNHVQEQLELIKFRMHARTVDHYKIKELS